MVLNYCIKKDSAGKITGMFIDQFSHDLEVNLNLLENTTEFQKHVIKAEKMI